VAFSQGIPSKLFWMRRRLGAMSPLEVVHRVKTMMSNQLQKIGLLMERNPPSPSFVKKSVSWFGRTDEVDPRHICEAADKILRGHLSIFELNDVCVGHPPQWNRDPVSGTNAPLVFGKTLDYRDERLVGDIKYLWEPNRHLHLVTLGQAYHLTKQGSYLDGIKLQVESWLEQCPYMLGPQWTSSLELSIRLINWYLVWQLIGGLDSDVFKGKEGEEFRNRWLKSIYQHAHFIKNHHSLYSSANNHLIGEAAGLFIATIGWPFWPEFAEWNESSRQLLERETLLQHSRDGVNREQAVAYQQFVLDFLILSYLTASANQVVLSKPYIKTIEKMLEFLASIIDVAGHVPMIGDADDGFVVHLSHESGRCPYQSLLVTGAVLFDRADFRNQVDHFDEKSRWILGDSAAAMFDSLNTDGAAQSLPRQFDEGGYYILGDSFGTQREIKIVADAGSLGYLSIAAHGHADALSFTLSAGGNELLIDPGTFSYHTKKMWRDYFRGTAAHNTLRVDGLDQSVIGGNFLWLEKAKIVEVDWQSNQHMDRLLASHDGYARLFDPVRHKRIIQYNKSEMRILVTDSLECKQEHIVEIFWHFAEGCDLLSSTDSVAFRCGDVKVSIRAVNCSTHPEIATGRTDPPLGWVSRRFGVKTPTHTVLWRNVIDGPCEFQTEISVDFLEE